MSFDLSSWAFRNKKLIYFLVAVLLAGGAYSSYEMSKLEDPEVKVKLALVVTAYPGASAHQVEMEVTDVLEKSIRTMGGLDNVESYSYNDVSLIQVELLSTVPDDEVEQQWDLLRRKVGDAEASLPSGAGKPMVKDDFGNLFGIFYALTGDGQSERELYDYAELLERELQEVEGVERVSLYGKREESIDITLLEERMATLGVKPAEVFATLNQQNQTTYAGYFGGGDMRVRVTVSDKFRTVEDIGAMIIQGHSDDQLRLRDIARIEKSHEMPVRNQFLYDGQRAIGILVAAAHGADIVKVGRAVEKRLSELECSRLPLGMETHKVFYQPERVTQSLGSFVLNLIESVAIVVVILMLAMGLRSGVIIGISLIVTVFGSFLVLQLTGGTMQRVSLAAFVLAMGMLVDNAIVIVDGILVDLKAGKPRQEALTAIGRQTAMPLLGATLIAIIAFLPIYLSPDTAGVYTHDLFVVLAVSLLLSWVLALTHVPLMANRLLPKAAATSEGKPMYNGKVYKALRASLLFGLRHRWGFVVSMVILLLLSLVGYRYTKQGFFPDMVYDQLYVEYKLPEGTNYTRVERDLREIEAYLRTREEVTHVAISTGGTPGRYNLVRSIANPSLSYGELIVDFTSPKALERNIDEIQAHLSDAYPDAYVKLKRYNLMFKKYPIEAQFCGPDPKVLHQLADSATAIVRRTPEVCLPTTDWEPPVPLLTIEYDQPAARSLGLSRGDVSLSLLTATGGIPIGSFYEGEHRNTVYLKSCQSEGKPVEDLAATQVFTSLPSFEGLLSEETMARLSSGTLSRDDLVEAIMGSTPLGQVSKAVSISWEDPVVPRYNGERSQRVQCSPSPGVETEKARQAIARRIEAIPLPEGYSLRWQGERAASTRSMKYLFRGFPLAVILMVAILIMLFKDYRKPLVIFCCLPMILVGVVAVMLLTGKVFNFVAIVGTLGLMGMLIKNGIVLMDEITLELRQGSSPTDALLNSAQSRLRPVMMASLTTILGMIPLLGDDMFGSLAAAIMGGLLFATVVTLLFLPVLFALFFHIKPSARQ
ncbi:MAG: efflux RND transporter permease subunit [Prevotellaceae bacterium]|nr:efflux RND transporter permease subunit [Prevotellaceae bacterium]